MKQAKTTGKKLGALLLSACILMSMPGMAPAAGVQTPQTVRTETEQGDLHQPEAQAAAENAVSAEPENNPNSAEGESRPDAESPAAPADTDETNTTGEPNETDKNSADKPKSRPAGLSKEPAEVLTEQEEPSVSIKLESEEPLYLPEDKAVTDADLMAGVTAADENGEAIEVTVQDVDGLDMENPKMRGMAEPYTITYAAVHPVSDEVFTVTRKAYVTVGVMPLASTPNIIDLSDSDADLIAGATTSGGKYSYDDTTKIIAIYSGPITVTGSTTDRRVCVYDTVDITLDNVTIDVSATGNYTGAISLQTGANATLTLAGNNVLTGIGPGLEAPEGTTLTIEAADASQTLTATGGSTAAGIGGDNESSGGTVIINGGTVTAMGQNGGAGIGSGRSTATAVSGGTITINGGIVEASCQQGNAIGTGQIVILGSDTGSDITINGGSVKASSLSSTPTDGSGNTVYLGTLPNQSGVTSISVDEAPYYIDGNHNGDNALYLYMTGEDHIVDVEIVGTVTQYEATWTGTGFTWDAGTPQTNPVATSVSLSLSPNPVVYGSAASVIVTATVTDSSLGARSLNMVDFYLEGASEPFASSPVISGVATATLDISSLSTGSYQIKAAYGGSFGGAASNDTKTLQIVVNAETPNITGHPTDRTYNKGSSSSLLVSAVVGDGGALSYQWYSNTVNSISGGMPVGGDSDTYAPDTSAVGTTYYYCVVTNTNLSVAGTQTASATSLIATVRIIDEPDVAAISAPAAVFVGDRLTLTAPAVTDNGDTVTDEGWEISEDGATGWAAFDPAATIMTYAHNGQSLRYFATNSVGTSHSNTVQITVNKLNLTLALTCANITYGNMPDPQLSGNTGGGTETFEYKTLGAPDGDYRTAAPTEAGDYTVRASVAATDTYNTAEAEADFRIEKAVPGISLSASPAGGAYADDSVTLTAALTGIDPGDYPTGNVVFKNGGATLGTGTLVNGEAVFVWQNVPFGTHALTAEYAGDNNYESASDSISGYDIQKKTQAPLSITGVPAALVYGDSSFSLGTTGGSGTGAVTYTVQSGDAVSVSGDTVTIEKAGTAVIKVAKEADNVYNETSVTISVTVAKAVPGIQSDPSVIGANVGEMLSALSLTNLTAYGADGSALSGSFAWENPQTVVQATGKFKAIFTPDDESYETVTCDVQVSLDTAMPVITSVKATPSANGAKLEAAAEAGTPLSYQWQVKGSWIDIPGATAAVFDYTGLSADTEYTVRVIVTDANGNSTTSEPVTFKTGAAAVTGLPENYTLSNGKSVSWTPRPAGGTWSYDKEYLSIKREGDTVTFTAQKAGKTTVTYTAGGTQYVVTIIITDSSAVQTNNNSTTPQTGDNGHVGLWLALLGIGSAGILGIFVRQKKRKSFQ